MKGFSDAKVGKDKSPRLTDLVDVFEWPQDDYEAIRLVGPVYSYCNVWFDIITKTGKKVSIPKLCIDHDGATDDYATDVCPYRASGRGRSSKYYVVNAIVRSIQEDKKRWPKPEGKKTKHLGYECYLTKRGSKNTPVRVIVIGSSVAEKIQQMQKLNRVKRKDGSTKTYEASDPKYGFDLNILFDPSKEGARKYDVQKGDRSPLSDEELDYPLYRLDLQKADTVERAKREMEDLKDKIIDKKDDKKGKKRRDEDDEDEDEDDRPRKGKKSPKIDDDDLTDLDEEDLLGDDDEDEDDDRPAKKKKKGAKSKPSKAKKRRDEDEDEDDEDDDLTDLDDDDDDDDEDDRPAKKKKRARDDDDEDDFDDDDADDEDSSDDDDEDDEDADDDDGDDEEEEERPRKKSASSKKKGGKPGKSPKSKKRRRDDY